MKMLHASVTRSLKVCYARSAPPLYVVGRVAWKGVVERYAYGVERGGDL